MELTFKLTEQEAQVMLNAIAKEPYGLVSSLINKIQTQADEQMKQKEA